MIIDVHTHCIQPEHLSEATHRENRRAGYAAMQPFSIETYLEAMAPVDRAIVFGVRALATGSVSPNDFTAQWVAQAPDKLIGFMAIDPMEEDHLEQVDRGVDMGLRGIKLYPMLGRYDPADPTVFALYEKAQRLGLPVLSHVGTHPHPRAMLKYSLPMLFDEIAQAFPALKIVIAHMGHPWQRDCAVVIRKHPNVYADVSGVWARPWQGWDALITMIEWGVADKLFFGSDFPIWTPQEGMAKIRRLNDQLEGTALPRISEAVIEGIFHRDALACIGLEK